MPGGISMVEPIARAVTAGPQAAGTTRSLGRSSKQAMNFLFGAQRLLGEEITFAGGEMLDRAQTETHLFNEFLSKLAQAHSVNDIRMMYEVCGQHQLDFVRRDCERLLKHTQRSVDAWSRLFGGGSEFQV
jgi:hypothetical protein